METVKEKLIDEIESLDWYHVNQKGKLVHGASSEDEAYWKCSDAMAVIERVLQDGDKSSETDKWVSVDERLPELVPCNAGTAYSEAVNIWTSGRKVMVAVWDGTDFLCDADYWEAEGEIITHWKPIEPPKAVQ